MAGAHKGTDNAVNVKGGENHTNIVRVATMAITGAWV